MTALRQSNTDLLRSTAIMGHDWPAGTEVDLEVWSGVAGTCECGCGLATSIIEYSDASNGLVRGHFRRFRKGHQSRMSGAHFRVEESGCWRWLRNTQVWGYGVIWNNTLAHRWVYQVLVGAIPDGLTLDHLCVNKLCVNPDHLEPVTLAENHRRWAEGRRSA